MRRMSVGFVPALLLVTGIGTASAQTRTAPSIGDAIRRQTGRVTAQQGVRTRGVNLPEEQRCDGRNDDYRYDGRYDRGDRGDRGKHKGWEKNGKNEQRERQEEAYGCCTTGTNGRNGSVYGNNGSVYGRNGTGTIDNRRGNGSGTITRSGTVLRGTGTTDPRNANQCGFNQRDRDRRDGDRDRDHDRGGDRDHDRDHDFDRSRD